jgi:hypothetical protein
MYIIKSSGEKQRFSPKKIYQSILDAGASKSLARETTNIVKSKAKNGITTQEISKIITLYLKKHKGLAERYNLKKSIMSLGPTGYIFEKYFAKLLEEYGYKTEVGRKLKGKDVEQEIDILAENKNKKYLVECKYHNEAGIYTGLKVAMYTHARFLDVQKHKLNQAWLATNTHCSHDAIKYSRGVNLKLTSWRYPEDESLRKMIEEKKLYPITILNLSEEQRNKFISNNLILLKQIIEREASEISKHTGIKTKDIEILKKEGKEIIGRAKEHGEDSNNNL